MEFYPEDDRFLIRGETRITHYTVDTALPEAAGGPARARGRR